MTAITVTINIQSAVKLLKIVTSCSKITSGRQALTLSKNDTSASDSYKQITWINAQLSLIKCSFLTTGQHLYKYHVKLININTIHGRPHIGANGVSWKNG